MEERKNYIGVKLIQAEPKERDGKEGYAVFCPQEDGTWYESWSPKWVFEKAYFPIADASKISQSDIESFISQSDIKVEKRNEKSTLVDVVMPTGFTDYEVSSCVVPANYDEELGKRYALANIKGRLWSKLGFMFQWAKCGLK